MKNKELKDLLILLRDHMVENKDECSGICKAAYCMYTLDIINSNQHSILVKFLGKNLPVRKYRLDYIYITNRFYGDYVTSKGDEFCWKPFNLKPRLNWLDKQIKKLES